eukprot:2422780-Amphidinium_carterae.1
MDQVEVSEAEGLSALVMAARPPFQEIVPTSLAIFKEVERPSLRVAAAVPTTPVRSSLPILRMRVVFWPAAIVVEIE